MIKLGYNTFKNVKIIPVSYTHLDVYKRQSVQLHIFLANSLCFRVVCVCVCVHPFKLTLFHSTHVGQSHTLILKHPISTMQYNS